MTTSEFDLDRAIHEVVIASYEMFAARETDETTKREYLVRAEAMRAESE
jgi:hypothetical protein